MFDAFAMPMERGFDASDALDASDAPATPAVLRLDAVEVSASPALPLPEPEARLTELGGHLNAATHRFLAPLAEFDRREGWADGAMRSCAHWLGRKCGLDLGAAREKARVATPGTEDALLTIAQRGTAHHVEAVVRGCRRARRAELSPEAQQHAGRTLRRFHDEDGSLVMQVRLAATDGAIVLRALERAVEMAREDERRRDVSAETSGAVGCSASESSPSAGHVPAETSEPADSPTQHRADALVRLAESWLARGDAALPGGERQTLVVHVDARTLAADAEGRSELDAGPALAAETVRRLGCDASLVAILEDRDGRILDVGRRTRSIPPSIARALRSRDRGCRYPGCTRTRTRCVDGHHVERWAHGGATKLPSLVLPCRRYHRRAHEGGAGVQVLDDGAIVFTDALGRRLVDAPVTRGSTEALVAAHRREGPHIDPERAPGRRAGEALDLGLAVEVLLVRMARHASASATTAAPEPPKRPTAPPSRG